jgi:hypothetical protein
LRRADRSAMIVADPIVTKGEHRRRMSAAIGCGEGRGAPAGSRRRRKGVR